jgi:hypothetical protein
MAVKVILDNSNRTTSSVQHGKGTDINVSDGHLVVISGTDRLALYAPGAWLRAEVTD